MIRMPAGMVERSVRCITLPAAAYINDDLEKSGLTQDTEITRES